MYNLYSTHSWKTTTGTSRQNSSIIHPPFCNIIERKSRPVGKSEKLTLTRKGKQKTFADWMKTLNQWELKVRKSPSKYFVFTARSASIPFVLSPLVSENDKSVLCFQRFHFKVKKNWDSMFALMERKEEVSKYPITLTDCLHFKIHIYNLRRYLI